MKTRTTLVTLLALATTLAALAHAAPGTTPPTVTPIGSANTPVVLAPDTNSGDFLKPFVQWMTTHPQGFGNYAVGFTLTSNQQSGLASRYCQMLWTKEGGSSGDPFC